MRRPVMASLLAASVLTAAIPALPAPAAAQQQAAPAPAPQKPADPLLRVNPADLPPLPPVIPAAERQQMVLMASGAGAVIGVLVVDLVTGGLLLAPLGVPGATSFLSFGAGGAAAAAAPTYTIAQRVLAGAATIASAVGGGYIGSYVAKSRPDYLRLGE